ncbi:MAG: NTP-binding protein, partial [Planctomycetaceae bacterium]|nr:NTP-binding protein [Planctomycetaceae bacterium]
DCCELRDGYQVPIVSLFKAWKDWCDQKGRKPGNEQTFGRDLSAAASHVTVSRLRYDEKRYRVYNGIKLT